jgi:hypothetical protein
MNLFFILPIAVSSYAEENQNSKIAVSLTTEGSWNPVDGKVNWENYMNVNAETCLWKKAMVLVNVLANQNTRIGRASNHWDEAFRPSKDGWTDVFEIGYVTSSKTGNFAGEYYLGVVSGHTPHKSINDDNCRYYNSNFFNWSIYIIERPLFSGSTL